MPAQILIVEDDPVVRELVCDSLSLAGHTVTATADGIGALNILRQQKMDLVVSDINMPKLDGYGLLEKLREGKNQTPVIFLTARNEKPDVSRGFKLGADDYISKPFGVEELVLRVGAVLRRTQREEVIEPVITIGPISIDVESMNVRVEGESVSLSPTEYKLLMVLIENKNKVVSRQYLLDVVWGMGFADSATVVDTYISYLRRKLHSPSYQGIQTVRGFGFKISDHQ